MTLLFLRHGETDWNAQGLIQGRTDIPLNETGRAQAREQAAALRSHQPPVGIIYASPLKRASETAQIIQQALGVPLRYDDRLVEQCFGSLEGTRITHWMDAAELAQHGAEPFPALYERVCDFLDELDAAHAGQTVLVVAHGRVASMVQWYYHGHDNTDAALHKNAVLRRYPKKCAGHRPPFIV